MMTNPEETTKDFFNQIRDEMKPALDSDQLGIASDFNARVGFEQ